MLLIMVLLLLDHIHIVIQVTSPFARDRRKDWHLVMLHGHATLRVCLKIYYLIDVLQLLTNG